MISRSVAATIMCVLLLSACANGPKRMRVVHMITSEETCEQGTADLYAEGEDIHLTDKHNIWSQVQVSEEVFQAMFSSFGAQVFFLETFEDKIQADCRKINESLEKASNGSNGEKLNHFGDTLISGANGFMRFNTPRLPPNEVTVLYTVELCDRGRLKFIRSGASAEIGENQTAMLGTIQDDPERIEAAFGDETVARQIIAGILPHFMMVCDHLSDAHKRRVGRDS